MPVQSTSDRPCPGPDCDTRISNELAFCRLHWAMLPFDKRDLIELMKGRRFYDMVVAQAAGYLKEAE